MIFKTLWRNKNKKTDRKSVIVNTSDSFKYKAEIETRFADFDMMGHVNNAIYFTYLEIARAKYWNYAIKWDWKKTGVVIASASLDYVLPILLEDKISINVRTSRIGKSSFDLEYLVVKMVNGKEEVCATGKTTCVAFDYENRCSFPIPEEEKARMISFEQLDS
ncbi:thioesterase family protein [Pedobacter sp. ASV1-7]|uniref:acyl-CoA thioesterase n=1 Tax=Pedobacter sp. ASV1-7 TaxID=3145237 RepID=UPI0032E8C978